MIGSGGLAAGALGTKVLERYARRGSTSGGRVVRFTLALAPGQKLLPAFVPMVAISPDAKHVLFSSVDSQLYLRPVDRLETKPISGARGGAPFFSPDGQWVAYRDPVARATKKVSLSGGAPITMFRSDLLYGAAWGTDGYVYATVGYPGVVNRIRADGGTLEEVSRFGSQKREWIHKFVELLLIVVSPDTVVRWHRCGFQLYWRLISRVRKPMGRRPVTKEIRELISKMAAENPTWRAPRIHGELVMR